MSRIVSIWGYFEETPSSVIDYGGDPTVPGNPADCPSDDVYLETLYALINSIELVVDKCFPAFVGYASVIGEMSAQTFVPAFVVIRMIWGKEHPGVKYTNSDYQQFELIDLYLRHPGFDWRDDAYITVDPYAGRPPPTICITIV